MNENEMHLRAIVRPAVQFGVKMRTEQSVRGEVQKGSGGGLGAVVHTKEEWRTQYNRMMSVKGVWYIYSDYREEENPETHEIILIPRGKVGDGMSYVVDLPFATMSITDEDIARWDDKVGAYVDEETHNLVFYK